MRIDDFNAEEQEGIHAYAKDLNVSVAHCMTLFNELDGTTDIYGGGQSLHSVVEMNYEMRTLEVVAYIQNILRARA